MHPVPKCSRQALTNEEGGTNQTNLDLLKKTHKKTKDLKGISLRPNIKKTPEAKPKQPAKHKQCSHASILAVDLEGQTNL